MTPGKLIGRGAQADVFAYGEDRVLKLFKKGADPQYVASEARLARLVHETGLPVPAVDGVVTHQGRPGIIYQHIKGRPITGEMAARPWRLWAAARRTAALHAEIHDTGVPDLPLQRERLRRRIKSEKVLSEELRAAVLHRLDRLPGGDRLCHGDFHPQNILVPPGGELGRAVVIDWPDASTGNPVGDVARTVLLMRLAHHNIENGAAAAGLKLTVSLFLPAYLKHYTRLRGLSRSELAAWLVPLAAARLGEGFPRERRALLDLITRGVSRSGGAGP